MVQMNRYEIQKRLCYFLAIVFLILGIFFFSRAYGYENIHAIEKIQLHFYKGLDYEQCSTFEQKRQFHKENAERCLNDAKECCWWLPNLSHRKKAQYCFTNTGILLIPGDPKVKVITALVNTLIQYGLDCCDEWHYINNKLYWAQYHTEMYDFYTDLVSHGYIR